MIKSVQNRSHGPYGRDSLFLAQDSPRQTWQVEFDSTLHLRPIRFEPHGRRLESRSFFARNKRGKDLFCLVDGFKEDSSKPAVLIVHGFKGWSTQRHIRAISDALVGAGFLTIRPDLTKNPGRSYLEFPDMTYGQELADCEDVLDYILKSPWVDGARIGITGHSLGGMLAAQLASKRHEVKSLVTLCAVYDFRFVAKKFLKGPSMR